MVSVPGFPGDSSPSPRWTPSKDQKSRLISVQKSGKTSSAKWLPRSEITPKQDRKLFLGGGRQADSPTTKIFQAVEAFVKKNKWCESQVKTLTSRESVLDDFKWRSVIASSGTSPIPGLHVAESGELGN